MFEPKRVQELYNYIIERIQIATANDQINKAKGEYLSDETGRMLAYSDVARRLVDIGCRKESEVKGD